MSATGEVAALREEIADLKSVIEEQANRIDLLLKERAEDRQRIAELEEYRAENEHDKATIRQQVTSTEQADGAESDESDARDDSMTPMERLVRLGEESIMTNVTASVRRAEAIATHFGQWASRTPNGLVVKDNLKNLLETATSERLAWKQVYRAARALEKFTKGAIRFEKHRRHGWMLVAEPAIVSRLGRVSTANGG
jgi:DNA gyrase/topoisomerase IV subunit A